MANDLRGEVEFDALGKKWTMRLGNGAVRSIEAKTGLAFPAIGKALGDEETARIELFTTVFMGSLQGRHPDITMEDCDDIIDDIGQEHAGVLIGQAFERMQPKAKDQKGGANRPRKATTA
ncbi:hypothetical protein VQ042_11560 [Aurantimonas sp. A2-1-M11]|uniref:hypothetical protein n=1 Tax=Aurantimonas sp. A2-1-M11 TaxID=3113712 RepID=UPI002F947FB3